MLSNKEKYDKYRPKKFLGQNFLVDKNIAAKIVKSLDIKDGDNVLEIGPGQGALTKSLSEKNINYSAVELDKGIYEKLKGEYGDRIDLIHKDFLKLDFESNVKHNSELKIIGNIPYNITSEILFKIIENREYVSEAVMMMQKEVAQRLIAKPNTKEYGILAVQVGYFTEIKVLFNVPPTAFFPKPKVHSSIVRFKMRSGGDLKDEALFKKLVRQSFGQRRKVMRNSLKELFEELKISFDSVNFDFSRRPESVSIKEFVALANELYDNK